MADYYVIRYGYPVGNCQLLCLWCNLITIIAMCKVYIESRLTCARHGMNRGCVLLDGPTYCSVVMILAVTLCCNVHTCTLCLVHLSPQKQSLSMSNIPRPSRLPQPSARKRTIAEVGDSCAKEVRGCV